MNRFAAVLFLACMASSNASAQAQADVQVTQVAAPNPAVAGKDLEFSITATNAGPDPSGYISLVSQVPAGVTVVWVWPFCNQSGGNIVCVLPLFPGGCRALFPCNPPGTTFNLVYVFRPAALGSVTHQVAASAGTPDPSTSNNTSSLTVAVGSEAAGVPVPRYRLYSPVTLEHHFTTDLNEYNTLGGYADTWTQEGTMGRLLDNPGTFNGVAAVPYYRLFHAGQRIHHWTADGNEYYQLRFNGWVGEGVAGYILPTAAAGTTQLYRLHLPDGRGRHHWTTDLAERNTLVGQGWEEEGGSGYVIQ